MVYLGWILLLVYIIGVYIHIRIESTKSCSNEINFIFEDANPVEDEYVNNTALVLKDSILSYEKDKRKNKGLYVAVLGGWGTGKSTIINTLEKQFKKYGFLWNRKLFITISMWKFSDTKNTKGFHKSLLTDLANNRRNLLKSKRQLLTLRLFLVIELSIVALLAYMLYMVFNCPTSWIALRVIQYPMLINIVYGMALAIGSVFGLVIIPSDNSKNLSFDEAKYIFKRIVNHKTRFLRKKLVIVFDDLDRTENPSEIIEELKTYFDNPKCIYNSF